MLQLVRGTVRPGRPVTAALLGGKRATQDGVLRQARVREEVLIREGAEVTVRTEI